MTPELRKAVRPRDAATLILLRDEGHGLEALVGRRPLGVRFMPGVYVFPGGAIDPPDRLPWGIETGSQSLPPRLAASARAALRETWEETGVLIGYPTTALPPPLTGSPIEIAYREQGVAAALDALTYVGRAITPSRSPMRFNTRFFLGAGDLVRGEPKSCEELEDVGWHQLEDDLMEAFRDVTRFMLARAIELRAGTANGEPPLFYTVGTTRRVRTCREAVRPSG